MLRRLAPADYATLAGLGLGWTATCLLLLDRPDAATLTLLVAFLFDKLDGSLARRGFGSPLGFQLDALADVVVYLVPTVVLVAETLAAPPPVALAAGGSVLGFGVLRLARYGVDGGNAAGGVAYYRGATAFHVAAWALAVRLVVARTGVPPLAGALAIGAVAPVMIAPVRVYATRRQLVAAVAVGVLIAAGALVGFLAPA